MKDRDMGQAFDLKTLNVSELVKSFEQFVTGDDDTLSRVSFHYNKLQPNNRHNRHIIPFMLNIVKLGSFIW